MHRWLLGFLLSLPASGASVCQALLTTSFGYRGPLIAGLQPNGQLTILEDTYAPDYVPAFSRSTTSFTLPFQHALRSLTSVPDSEKKGGFLASVSNQGELTVMLPDGRAIPVFLPMGRKVRTASLYRVPVREIEKHWVKTRGLRFQQTGGMSQPSEMRKVQKRVEFSERHSILHLFLTSGRSIYRVSLRYRDLHDEDSRLNDALTGGMALAETDHDDNSYVDWRPSKEHFIDLMRTGGNSELLIATPVAKRVVTVSDFQEVFTLPEKAVMSEIDYVQAISQKELVAGSESGEVVRIDLEKQEIAQTLAFPTPVYVTSLSAHLSEGHLEVWAVGGRADGPALFKYESTCLGPVFEQVTNFPRDVRPQQVATFGSPVPVTYEPRNRGFLSSVRGGPQGLEVEEVLVLGTDGSLVALRDPVGCFELDCEQEWFRFPFIESAN